jgi:hypothetical protein
METKNKPVLLNLSQLTIDRLKELDDYRTMETGRGNNKSQIVRDAIELIYLKVTQEMREER